MTTTIAQYFSPTFFSPYYFPPLIPGSSSASGSGIAQTSPTQYFTPTFFSPYYFPPLVIAGGGTSGSGITPTTPAQYFAPTFFSPYYFPPLVAFSSSSGSGRSPFRDRDAYNAIISALKTTGEFADVAFGTTVDRRVAGADLVPAAVITPNEWTELDDVDPSVIVRWVSYTITVVVRDEDPAARYEALDRLTSLVQNAIDGSDLGGVTLPALTLLGRGRFDPSCRQPEQTVVLDGEFTYLIPSMTGHNVSY